MTAPEQDTSATALAIDRTYDDWAGHQYHCRECGQSAETVAAIDHAEECSVSRPDDIDTPFHESTDQLRHQLLDKAMHFAENAEYVTDVEDDLVDEDGVRWTDSESTSRFVLGLGRASPHGKFHLDDRRGLVLKLDLNVRHSTDYTPVSGNLDELYTWEVASATDTTQFFGDVLACARDGAWLVMEQCIPIEFKRTRAMNRRDILFDKGGQEYVMPLLAAAQEAGWVDADYKHGNVGLTDDGVPVFIDYGTGPTYDPEPDDN